MVEALLWLLALPLILLSPYLVSNAAVYCYRNPTALAALLVTCVPAAAVFMLRTEQVSASQAVLIAGGGSTAALAICALRSLGSSRGGTAVPLILFFAFMELLSAYLNEQMDGTASSLGNLVALLTAPVVAYTALKTLPRPRIATMTLVVSGVLILASYAAEVVAPSGVPVGESRFGIAPDLGRLSGVTTNPNALGAVALAFILTALSTTNGRLRVGLVVLAMPAVVLSQQRAAVLGVALGVLACFYYRHRVLTVVAGLGAVALSLLRSPGSNGLGASTAGEDRTVQSRFTVWNFIAENWEDAVLYGWGPQGLRERSLELGLQEAYSHAHNQILNALAVGGVLLTFITVALIIRMVLILLRAPAAERGQQFVLIVGLAPLYFFESPLQTGMNPLTQPQAAVVWMATAIALAPLTRRDQSSDSGARAKAAAA